MREYFIGKKIDFNKYNFIRCAKDSILFEHNKLYFISIERYQFKAYINKSSIIGKKINNIKNDNFKIENLVTEYLFKYILHENEIIQLIEEIIMNAYKKGELLKLEEIKKVLDIT
jgi:hypothetical protein